MRAKRFTITGLVQGVFYRAETQKRALELALTGWVRNREDGSVEIHAEGSEEALKQLEQWCWTGPAGATVTEVAVTEEVEENRPTFDVVN